MIQFQIGDRKTGKTTQLLNWMKQAPGLRVMVCANHQMAAHAFARAKEMGMEVEETDFIAFGNIQALRGRNVEIGIDNLDLILNTIFYGQVEFVTATGEDTLRIIT